MSLSGGIPARLVEEQELGDLDSMEKKLLHHEIVKDLFKWYDKDGNNAIDCNGLLALMSDLVVDTSDGGLSIGETNKFMALIDQDGDRLLQVDELVQYMMERWSETAPKASQFNNDVGAFLSVVYPIVQRKLLARWRAERGIPTPPPGRAPLPGAPPPPPPLKKEKKKKKSKKKKKDKKESLSASSSASPCASGSSAVVDGVVDVPSVDESTAAASDTEASASVEISSNTTTPSAEEQAPPPTEEAAPEAEEEAPVAEEAAPVAEEEVRQAETASPDASSSEPITTSQDFSLG
jgi:hypothetical protein